MPRVERYLTLLLYTWIGVTAALLDSLRSDSNSPVDSQIAVQAVNLTEEAAIEVAQQPFDAVWARVLRGVNTECKVCHYSRCPNKDWYGSSNQFSAKCWTTGAQVGN